MPLSWLSQRRAGPLHTDPASLRVSLSWEVSVGTSSPSPILLQNAGPWSRAGKVGWPREIMQGGPQLPRQLTAINK